MKFEEYLQELFNKPVKFRRQSSAFDSQEYRFVVWNKGYEVKFYEANTPEYPDSYELIFVLTDIDGDMVRGFDMEVITGTGDAIAVFSTVANILKDFVRSTKPNIIYYSAKEQSRIQLYKTLSKKISSMSYLKNNYITTHKGKRWFINSQEELDDPFIFMREVN